MMRPTRFLPVCLLALCWFLACSVARSQEWTRFRGPNGTGETETSFPAEFNSSGLRWEASLPGSGHGSPVLWEDRLFVLSADPKTATRHVVCLDCRTGEQLWVKSYSSKPHHLHQFSSYASGTPAVDAERVYLAWATPESTLLMALDHDGHEVWQKDLGPWVSQHGFGTSPMLYQDLVILFNSQQGERLDADVEPGRSAMLAFDAETGREVWKTPLKSVRVCYSVPTVYTPGVGRPEQLICTSTAEGVFSVDPETGKLNWTVPDSFSMRVVSSPVVAGGLIFGSTGSGGGGNYVVAVQPGPDAKIAYRIRGSAPYVPTPVAHDDLLFLWYDKGVVTCIDARSGDTIWRQRVPGEYFGSPIRAGDKLYCISSDGELVCLSASPNFEVLGTTSLGEGSHATPAVHRGRMYLRTFSKVICVESESS